MKKLTNFFLIASFCILGTLTSVDEVNPELEPIAIPPEIVQNECTMDLLDQWENSKYICTNESIFDQAAIDGVTTPTYNAEAASC